MKKILALTMVIFMLAMMAIPMSAIEIAAEDLNNIKFEIKKANTAWKADGTISDGEYYLVETKPTWFSAAAALEENGEYAKGLQPPVYMSWDDGFVYFATVVTVREFNNEYDADPTGMWQACAMQMNFSMPDETLPEQRLEYGIALSSATKTLLSTVWGDAMGSGFVPAANTDFIVTADGNKLTYECRTPWSSFLTDPAVKVGSKFGTCVVWAVGSGTDYIHAQLAQGCTGFGKHAEMFAQVTLADAPVVETSAPETVPETTAPAGTTTPAAPQTADIFGVVALVTMIAAAGVVISKKRG